MTKVVVTWYPVWLPYFVVRRSECSGEHFVLFSKRKEIILLPPSARPCSTLNTAGGKLHGDNSFETEELI
jgi:hypothetical protein